MVEDDLNRLLKQETKMPTLEKTGILSDEYYHVLFDSSSDVLMLMDERGFIDCNKAALKMFGFSRKEEIIGFHLSEISPPKQPNGEDSRSAAQDRISEAFKNESTKFEWVHCRKNGEEFPAEVWLTRFLLKDKQILQVTVRDITERKQMEETLRKSEASLSNAQRISHLGNWDWDLVKNKLKLSDEIYNILGLAPLGFETTYEAFLNSVHSDDRMLVQDAINKAVYENKPYSIDYRILLPDGSERIVHEQGEVTFNKAGQAIWMCGTIQDITEQKQIETALQKSEQKFRTFFNNSNDPTLIYDLDGTILEVNDIVCEFTGYSRDELLTMSIMDLDSSEYASNVTDNIKQLQKGIRSIFESVAICKDGTPIPIELSNRIIEYDGKPAVLSTSRDLTERKQAEDAMFNAKLVAETANRTKTEFLANISHELRTPLNSIIGFSQLLNSNPFGNLNEKEIKYSGNITDSGKHLLDLINDILDISKIESGEVELECEKFNLPSFIRDVENTIKHMAYKKNIEICNQFRSENIEIYADRLRMKQILYNLLSNSLKFTPEHGLI